MLRTSLRANRSVCSPPLARRLATMRSARFPSGTWQTAQHSGRLKWPRFLIPVSLCCHETASIGCTCILMAKGRRRWMSGPWRTASVYPVRRSRGWRTGLHGAGLPGTARVGCVTARLLDLGLRVVGNACVGVFAVTARHCARDRRELRRQLPGGGPPVRRQRGNGARQFSGSEHLQDRYGRNGWQPSADEGLPARHDQRHGIQPRRPRTGDVVGLVRHPSRSANSFT